MNNVFVRALVLLVLLAATILGFHYIWSLSSWIAPVSPSGQQTSRSDTIAAVSALVSALALVALIYTILLQHGAMVRQRKDQAQLEKQVEDQGRHLSAQSNALARQAFENTFFHLLRFHEDNVRSQEITLLSGGQEFTGRRAFQEIATILQQECSHRIEAHGVEWATLENINELYASVAETPYSDFGHYFRNLYHIIKYVDGSEVKGKETYTSQVRAQLSQPEFILLFFNGLRRRGNSKFKPLILKYALLHEMRLDPPFDVMRTHYGPGAFGTPEQMARMT